MMEININELLAMIGRLTVENEMLNRKIIELRDDKGPKEISSPDLKDGEK